MPRIRQYAERDATNDLLRELDARFAWYGHKSLQEKGKAIGVCPKTVCNMMANPESIKFGTLRSIVKVIKPDPVILLKALGYSSQDIRKIGKGIAQ